MGTVADPSADPGTTISKRSEDADDNSQDISRHEQGELQQNDFDVETVERVYRYVLPSLEPDTH